MPSNFTPNALFEHKAARLLIAVNVCQGAKVPVTDPHISEMAKVGVMPEVAVGSEMPSTAGFQYATFAG